MSNPDDLYRRLLRLAARLDGPGSLPRIEPSLRGDPTLAAVTTGGGAFLTVTGELHRISIGLKEAAEEIRNIAEEVRGSHGASQSEESRDG